MKKLYKFIQERKFNGDLSRATFEVNCTAEQAQAIKDKLAGRITVMVADDTLSDAPEVSDVVAGGLPIESISMVHSEAKSQWISAYGKAILFKDTVSVVELQNMFKLHEPFTGAYATEKPDNVFPKVSHMGNLG